MRNSLLASLFLLTSFAVVIYKTIPLSSSQEFPAVTPQAPVEPEVLLQGWWSVQRDCSKEAGLSQDEWPPVYSTLEAKLVFKEGEHFLDVLSQEGLGVVPLSVFEDTNKVRCFLAVAQPTPAPSAAEKTLAPSVGNSVEEESVMDTTEIQGKVKSAEEVGGNDENAADDKNAGVAPKGSEAGGASSAIATEGDSLDECCSGCVGFYDAQGSWVNCPGFKWRTKHTACEELKGMNVLLLGDSTMRRLYFTLSGVLKGSRPAAQPVLDTRPILEQRFSQKVPDRSVKVFIGGSAPKWKYSTTGCDGMVNITYKFVSYGSKTKIYLRDVVFPNNTQPTTVVFSIGIYNLVKDALLTKGKKGFNRVVDLAVKNDVRPELYQWVWKTPAPVNQSHIRFANLTQPANTQLQVWAEWSVKKAQAKGLDVVDSFTPMVTVKNLSPYQVLSWESGKEWMPPQHGGIHMLDDGRRLACQLVLHKLVELNRRRRGLT